MNVESGGSVEVHAGSVSTATGRNGGDLKLVAGTKQKTIPFFFSFDFQLGFTLSKVPNSSGGNVILQGGTAGLYGHGGSVYLQSGTGFFGVCL